MIVRLKKLHGGEDGRVIIVISFQAYSYEIGNLFGMII